MRAVLFLCVLSRRTGGVSRRRPRPSRAHLLDELVAIDTSNPPGNEDKAARLVAAKLHAAGIEAVLVPFAPGRTNLVARLKGDGSKRPLLLLAHLDVVGAAGQPWTMPPFHVTEKDGWLYGRGVTDDKSWAAMATALLIELKRVARAAASRRHPGAHRRRGVGRRRRPLPARAAPGARSATPSWRSTKAAACCSTARASRAW